MMKTSLVTARREHQAFSLIEILVSVAVLVLLLLIVSRLMSHTATIVGTGSKHVDTDTQARTVLDRMALDFGHMLKRSDVDYFIKQPGAVYPPGNSAGHSQGAGKKASSGQKLNDQIAFFSQVPGYYPSTGARSPISLVAYRVNAHPNSPAYLQLQRMGKGLLWNGVSNDVVTQPSNKSSRDKAYPIVFLPGQIAANAGPWVQDWGPWAAAITNNSTGSINNDGSQDPDYETVGPHVLRFEYYYLLKNGKVTDTPWDTDARPGQITLTNPVSIGLVDIEAIVVAIAAIDPGSRSLISASSLFDLASDMADFKSAPGRGVGGAKKVGDMEDQWKSVADSVAANGKTSRDSPVPAAAASAIRVYNRYFDLKSL